MHQGNTYDYIIFKDGAYKKVVNGVEYPATEDDLPKTHDKSACTECVFAEDKKSLLVWQVARELKELADHQPLFCGKFFMSGWTGHSSFYIFKCGGCGNITVDYHHGYRGDNLYLRCDKCRSEIILYPKKYKDIYIKDGLHVPRKPTFGEKRQMIRSAKRRLAELEKVSDMGVILAIPKNIQRKTFKQRLLALFGLD